jgi:uncharacterized repeat protein (TIGR02543 family)
MPSSNETYTAQWTANTYTVTYDGNGSDGGSTADSSHIYGVEQTLTPNGYTRTDYIFNGWNTAANGTGEAYTDAQSVTNLTMNDGVTVTLYAQWFSCGATSVTFTYNSSSVTYGVVGNPDTGDCWLDRNLGATQVATTSTDSASYGDYFQWGRPADGHQISNSATQGGPVSTITPSTSNFITSNSDWTNIDSDGALRSPYLSKTDGSGLCPPGFRLPDETELTAEINSWGDNPNAPDGFNSPLKWSKAGYRNYGDGTFELINLYGYAWSSSVSSFNNYNSSALAFGSSPYIRSSDRGFGYPVRCIRD